MTTRRAQLLAHLLCRAGGHRLDYRWPVLSCTRCLQTWRPRPLVPLED